LNVNYAEQARVDHFAPSRAKLGQLDIELTERCNNDCIHCCVNLPESDRAALRDEMSTAAVMRVLDEAAALGVLDLRFTGGEPLVRTDFRDIYLHARRLGLRVLLFTNARLISDELARLFARVPPLLPIEVSVYGMKRESYEAVSRQAGSFEEYRRGLDLLGAHGVPFVVKTASLPPNREESYAFREWASALPEMTGSPDVAIFLDLRQRRDSEEKNRRIRALRLHPARGLALLRSMSGEDLSRMRQFCARFMGAPGPRLFPCGAGLGIAVDAFGRAQPCLSLRAPELSYDLLRGSLAEALSDFFPKVRAMEATNPDYLERCARCFLKGLCEQCPAKSWAEHGTLDTPVEYWCDIAHEEARELGLLGPGEKAWQVADAGARVARLVGAKP
jgi:radical SAM protein with 4Fe4S-binding SPASM domain